MPTWLAADATQSDTYFIMFKLEGGSLFIAVRGIVSVYVWKWQNEWHDQ